MKTVLLTGHFLSGAAEGTQLILVGIFLLGLAAEAYVDLRHMIILDEILLVLIPAGLLYAGMGAMHWQDSLAGALTGSSVLGVVWILSRGGLGLGDVKFIGVLGLWLGVSGVVTGLALAFVTGGVAAAVLCLFGNASLQSKVPFGPFLSLGAVISFFYSSRILSWYWSLFI